MTFPVRPRLLLLLPLLILVSACGFQLRGSVYSLEQSYGAIKLVNKSGDEALYNVVEQALLDTGTSVTPHSNNILVLMDSDEDKRTASYSSRGKSAEYELLKEITFEFRQGDSVVIPETRFASRRSYLYRETAAVGKAEEENLLWEEMDADMAQRILLALRRSAQLQSSALDTDTDTDTKQ
ncbi:MAG: hypothetical protein SV765_02460 [Pseudomonadota bacterium]|nr:hypothetical protein [Pseudomonadota bacterium]